MSALCLLEQYCDPDDHHNEQHIGQRYHYDGYGCVDSTLFFMFRLCLLISRSGYFTILGQKLFVPVLPPERHSHCDQIFFEKERRKDRQNSGNTIDLNSVRFQDKKLEDTSGSKMAAIRSKLVQRLLNGGRILNRIFSPLPK